MKISNESLLCQKARVRWLKESDCNSKYFHSLINWKRRKNFVKGLLVDNRWVEEPMVVKRNIKEFFEKMFKEEERCRPKLDRANFKRIQRQNNLMLISVFKEEEVKEAIWAYGNDKSLDPDGFLSSLSKNFGRF